MASAQQLQLETHSPCFRGWYEKTAAQFALHSLATGCEPCSSCSLHHCHWGGIKGEGDYQNQIPYKTGKFSPQLRAGVAHEDISVK